METDLLYPQEIIKLDEGFKPTIYQDGEGFWTIGWGHYIGASTENLRISRAVAQALFNEDWQEALESAWKIWGKDFIQALPAGRFVACLTLAWNLGEYKLRKVFTKTTPAIGRGDWQQAANFMRENKKWFAQLKGRAERVCYMLETGNVHPYYSTHIDSALLSHGGTN